MIPCDVTVLHQLEYAAARVDSTLGRLDILVNNAGVGAFNQPLHKLAPEDWDRILNTNLRGVYFAIRAFVPLMIRARSGHVINISSLAGKNALPNGAAYAASKWGLNGLTYSVAEELRPHNIRRQRGLSRLHRNRTQPPRRQRSSENAAAGRHRPRRSYAGNASPAIVCQRDPAETNAKTLVAMKF